MNILHKLLIIGSGIIAGSLLAPLITNSDGGNANASIPTSTYDMIEENGRTNGLLNVPDFGKITFRHLGKFSEPGFIESSYDGYAGYGLGRQWQAGDLVTDVLKLGDLEESFGIGKLTLNDIVTKSGRHSNMATLDRFGFMDTQTIASFLKANPQLKELPIQDVPPLADAVAMTYADRGKALLELPARVLIQDNRRSPTTKLSLNKNVKKFAQNKAPKLDISEFEMGNLDLSEYTLGEVEGLGDSFIEEYEDWKDEHLSDIEGIADISLDDFPNPIATTLAFISRVDAVWSDAHGQIKPGHSVSGSNQTGYAVPCEHSCAHIELDDIENSGRNIRNLSEGRRWMLGKDPNNANICPEAPWGVDGGEGILGILNCGKEPTGRNPFGPAFKQALWSVDETKDEATTAIFFRICKRGIPDLGCTPYFIGPIPFLPANRENWIILGPGF